MTERLTLEERRMLAKVLAEIHEQGWGIAFGSVLGLGLLIVTNVLIFRGGDTVGPPLSLLSVYLPGYSVTVIGSLIGFVYAFVIGYGGGRSIATIYNYLVLKGMR